MEATILAALVYVQSTGAGCGSVHVHVSVLQIATLVDDTPLNGPQILVPLRTLCHEVCFNATSAFRSVSNGSQDTATSGLGLVSTMSAITRDSGNNRCVVAAGGRRKTVRQITRTDIHHRHLPCQINMKLSSLGHPRDTRNGLHCDISTLKLSPHLLPPSEYAWTAQSQSYVSAHVSIFAVSKSSLLCAVTFETGTYPAIRENSARMLLDPTRSMGTVTCRASFIPQTSRYKRQPRTTRKESLGQLELQECRGAPPLPATSRVCASVKV